jgi:NAD(P)H dehydrogenase (quinone)
MVKVLVIYHSVTGNTEKMAQFVAEGVKKEGVEVDLKKVENVKVEELLKYDGIVIGSPTYYGLPSAPVKKLIDDSVTYHGKLEGKIGGAFSSAAGIGGGTETTILAILEALMVHGMIVQGRSGKYHYGPVSINAPDKKVQEGCIEYGRQIARLVSRLFK